MHTPSRFDIYAPIHKGLRACFAQALVGAGRLDWTDDDEVAAVTAEVLDLLTFCQKHLEKENCFVHPAMEARRPGSAASALTEHVHHEGDIAVLREVVLTLRLVPALRREPVARQLYQRLAAFVTDNLAHMAFEESEHNRVLWETHSDDEIRAIEAAIVASLPPEESGLSLRWMLTAMSAEERAGFLANMRAHAPAEAFAGVLAMLRPLLGERDRRKLDVALGLPRVVADMTGAV